MYIYIMKHMYIKHIVQRLGLSLSLYWFGVVLGLEESTIIGMLYCLWSEKILNSSQVDRHSHPVLVGPLLVVVFWMFSCIQLDALAIHVVEQHTHPDQRRQASADMTVCHAISPHHGRLGIQNKTPNMRNIKGPNSS